MNLKALQETVAEVKFELAYFLYVTFLSVSSFYGVNSKPLGDDFRAENFIYFYCNYLECFGEGKTTLFTSC